MLQYFLLSQIFTFILVFCRVGGGILILPGFGESYVPTTIRLCFALAISLILTPILAKAMPHFPSSPLALFMLIGSEILTGLFIGSICSILISATHVAGMILSLQIGISSAVFFDITQASQGSLVGNFIGLLALVVIFATGLDHLMLRGITDSYTVFIPGQFPPLADFVETAARLMADTFAIALQITTPLIVAITLLFLGAGVLARLSPTMQVFFVVMPAQLLLGIFIFAGTFGAFMLWYMEFFRDKLSLFLGYVK